MIPGSLIDCYVLFPHFYFMASYVRSVSWKYKIKLDTISYIFCSDNFFCIKRMVEQITSAVGIAHMWCDTYFCTAYCKIVNETSQPLFKYEKIYDQSSQAVWFAHVIIFIFNFRLLSLHGLTSWWNPLTLYLNIVIAITKTE